LVFSVLAAIAEFERELIRERVVAGIQEARRRGKHCGRPTKRFDVKRAAELRQSGLSWRKLASATGVPVHLLRARLAGIYPSRRQDGGEFLNDMRSGAA
jgi:DNA invertase Pin-like site-specific DNA recombinase